MQARDADRFMFGDYSLDLQTRSLSRLEYNIPLRPRSFDVLVHLVRNGGTLIAKDDIIAAVWPGIIASDESLSRCISDIRAAIDDAAKEIIRTVPGRGYQFTAEVKVVPVVAGAAAVANVRNRKLPANWSVWGAVAIVLALAITGIGFAVFRETAHTPAMRASIAVMPFRNSSGDPDIEPFVVGLASDLNSALARIPEMLVIAESTMRQYKNKVVDVQQVADVLHVDNILAGAVQRSGDEVRVSVQLLHKDSGSATWSERYDRSLSNFLELQDDIVKHVLIGLQVKLTHGESARVLSRGTNNLDAWLANFQGLAEGFKFKRENNQNARDLFEQASKLDPNWAVPIGGIAWTYREALRRGWSSNVEADRQKWLQLARKCKEMDPHFSGCYIQLGNYFIENDRIEEGISLREKALELAPNDLSALSGLAWQLILVGEVKRGLELLQRAKRVSPLHPPWLIATEAYGYQVDGQYEKAIAGFEYALNNGNFPDWHARLAAVYAEIGEMQNARNQARQFIEKSPNGKVADLTRVLRIQDPERTRQYAELLRKSGIPD